MAVRVDGDSYGSEAAPSENLNDQSPERVPDQRWLALEPGENSPHNDRRPVPLTYGRRPPGARSSLKSAWPVLGNPLNYGRAIPLTSEQFRYGFANPVSDAETKQLCAQFAVPASGVQYTRRA